MSIRPHVRGLSAAACVAVLAGCGSSSGGSSATSSGTAAPATHSTSAAPTTTASASPTSNSTAAGAPGVPEPARQHTTAGAIAFAKYYVKKTNDTYLAPKAGVLEPLAKKSCKTCGNYAASVKEMATKHEHATVKTEIPRGAKRLVGERGMVIEIRYDQPDVKIVDAHGNLVQEASAKHNAGLVFFLEWTSNGWRVKEIQSEEPAAS